MMYYICCLLWCLAEVNEVLIEANMFGETTLPCKHANIEEPTDKMFWVGPNGKRIKMDVPHKRYRLKMLLFRVLYPLHPLPMLFHLCWQNGLISTSDFVIIDQLLKKLV